MPHCLLWTRLNVVYKVAHIFWFFHWLKRRPEFNVHWPQSVSSSSSLFCSLWLHFVDSHHPNFTAVSLVAVCVYIAGCVLFGCCCFFFSFVLFFSFFRASRSCHTHLPRLRHSAPVFREAPSYFGRQRVLLSEEVKWHNWGCDFCLPVKP